MTDHPSESSPAIEICRARETYTTGLSMGDAWAEVSAIAVSTAPAGAGEGEVGLSTSESSRSDSSAETSERSVTGGVSSAGAA